MGGGGRHVGGAGLEQAGWRVTGASVIDWKAHLSTIVRSRCPNRMESRLVRLKLAIASELQEGGCRLLRYAEDVVERYQSASAEAVLVGVSGRQQGIGLFP